MPRLAPLLALTIFLACAQPPPTTPAAATSPSATLRITGSLVESFDHPPYSFLKLKTDAGEVWTAVPLAPLPTQPKAKPLTVVNGVKVRGFDTGSGRRLDEVVFGTLE